MQKDPTLSEEVQSYIATLDWEGDRDIPPESAPKRARIADW